MAKIYVDNMTYAGRRFVFCRMWSDDTEALHKMARAIGLTAADKKCFFYEPNDNGFPMAHYAIVQTYEKARALALGAIEVDEWEYFILCAENQWNDEEIAKLKAKRKSNPTIFITYEDDEPKLPQDEGW